MFSIFKKKEYKEVMLPFKYVYMEEDDNTFIGIEAFGSILGETKYCYASYVLKDTNMYDNGDYEDIVSMLKNDNSDKMVKVKIKIKNNH